jgi:DtxR family Mn-dependent transcriptional regulator
MEDYLETIYLQDLEGQAAKVKNIADAMGVSKPSVTEALSVLQDRGLVLHQKYGDIELTDKGRHTAEDIYHRHKLLRDFFVDILAMDEEVAEDDACKVEHLISDTTTERVEALLTYIRKATSNGSDYKGFLKEFHSQLK